MNNEIKLVSIKDLHGKKFFIPNYQRGYKWREKDVEYLIDDIAEIAENDESDYCLQPIVVAPKNDENEFILVDGQQRLTTIWLIVNWAKHNDFTVNVNFDIHYDSRENSNQFLTNIKENGTSEDMGTCDTHYFSQALHIIAKKEGVLQSFLNNLAKNVKIIWYVIDSEEGPAHFERLNNAKISLTNAELVKAFLLTNAEHNRARMACEWDEMEYRLQNDEFFSFITTKYSIYNKDYNRIELLLDLYVDTTTNDREKDEFATFNRIAQKFEKEEKSIAEIWQEIQNVFNRLLCWYNDNFLYNLIGYLVECKGDSELSVIWKDSKEKSLTDIKEIVRERVVRTIPSNEEIEGMSYSDGRTKNILLLFNILSYMSVMPEPKSNEYKYVFHDKFHFDLYRGENWDKEHVHATASESLQSKVEWINWLKELDYNLVKEKLDSQNEKKEEYLQWIENAKSIESEEDYKSIKEEKNATFNSFKKEYFGTMFQAIVSAIEGESDDLKQNSIGNLVLLCANINRSGAYKVAPFSTKRRIIMERVKKGQFVPIGTQNVFMKVFTPNPGHFYKWEKDQPYDGNENPDRDNYIEAIVDTINRIK